ncbi:hypothetical protein ACQEU3_18240 [Spirillospora sp. CA-253888]
MKVCGVVVCAFVALVAVGCDSDAGTSAPRSVPVTGVSSSARSEAVTPAALRAALVREFRGGRLDDGNVQFGKAIDSGPLGKLDHASVMEGPWISPKACQSQMRTIDVGRTPDAPAAAITLRKSDTESGTQLLVGLSEGDIDAALKRRVPAACRKATVPGGGTLRVQDFRPPPVGLGAWGLRTSLRPPAGDPYPAVDSCTIIFRTGGGRVLGFVGYGAARLDESCPRAIELSRRLHDRVPS